MTIVISKQQSWNIQRGLDKGTVKFVDRIMPVFYTYFKTECYTNGGVVAAFPTLNDLSNAGYISQNHPTSPRGILTLIIDRTNPNTILNVSLEFDNPAQARKVFNIQSIYAPTLTDSTITWEASVLTLANSEQAIDEGLFLATNNCL
mgnify:CR=1 FL=1